MILKYIVLSLVLISLVNSTAHHEESILINDYDKTVSLVRDNEGKLYLRSKASEQCGTEYWYSDSASLDNGKNDITVEGITKPLNQIIDLESFKLDYINNNLYYFSDKNNRYLLVLTMCDGLVAYIKK